MAQADLHADLEEAALEEMERACELGWAKVAAVTPWGDTYEGYTPAGRDVCFERNYLWKDDPGYDICVEVVVYEPRDYEQGVRLMRAIPRSTA
jgi:hypothetical protein